MNYNHLFLNASVDLDLIQKEIPTQRFVEVTLRAPAARQNSVRSPLNLALVIDRSGSMHGEKLMYVIQAACYVIDLLDQNDSISVVVFDHQVNVLSPAVPASRENTQLLKERLHHLTPGGNTNLSGGWLTGCQLAAEMTRPGCLNRVFLLTDGMANEGITQPEELALHSGQLRQRGITTSTFGVGEGFNEHLLEQMANEGGGMFSYIANPTSIPAVFTRELRELFAITARNLELDITLPPQVSASIPGAWKTQKTAGGLRVILGDLAANMEHTLYVELITPPMGTKNHLVIDLKARAAGEQDMLLEAYCTIALRYESGAAVREKPVNHDLMRRLSRVRLAEAANESLKMERLGRRSAAKAALEHTLAAAAPYLDPGTANEYRDLSSQMENGLREDQRKERQYRDYLRRRGREDRDSQP